MKSLHGSAEAAVAASPKECFALLAAAERYPVWNGELIRTVEALPGDGRNGGSLIRLSIHVAQSPFGRDFELVMAVTTRALEEVLLRRVCAGDDPDRDELRVRWRLAPGRGAGTRIVLAFHATTGLIPRFIPLPGIGDQIAAHLLAGATQALGGALGDEDATTRDG